LRITFCATTDIHFDRFLLVLPPSPEADSLHQEVSAMGSILSLLHACLHEIRRAWIQTDVLPATVASVKEPYKAATVPALTWKCELPLQVCSTDSTVKLYQK